MDIMMTSLVAYVICLDSQPVYGLYLNLYRSVCISIYVVLVFALILCRSLCRYSRHPLPDLRASIPRNKTLNLTTFSVVFGQVHCRVVRRELRDVCYLAGCPPPPSTNTTN